METKALTTQASPSSRTYQQNSGVRRQAKDQRGIGDLETGKPAMAAFWPPDFIAWSRMALISIENAMTSAGTYFTIRSR